MEELVTTETDYHRQMLVCCEKLIPAMEEVLHTPHPILHYIFLTPYPLPRTPYSKPHTPYSIFSTPYPIPHTPHPIPQIKEVNSELLFGNLREVTCVSRDLLEALRETCSGEEKVGEVFVIFGPRLRSIYASYCRNHDNASSLVEKVCWLLLVITDNLHSELKPLERECVVEIGSMAVGGGDCCLSLWL